MLPTSTNKKIYYSCAVRGAPVVDSLVVNAASVTAKMIAILSSFGTVLTNHLASEETADMGGKTDIEIYEEDMRLLKECDVVIADVSTPSIGVGYVIREAQLLQKELIVVRAATRAKKSAMLANILVYEYSNVEEFSLTMRRLVLTPPCISPSSPVIVIVGPPGSGKSTIARHLSLKIGLPHISSGECVRNFRSAMVKETMECGDLISSDMMSIILRERFCQPDCKNGFILEGYPPTMDDLRVLQDELQITPSVTIELTCSKEVSIRRQMSRGERATDNNEALAEKRYNIFVANYDVVAALTKISTYGKHAVSSLDSALATLASAAAACWIALKSDDPMFLLSSFLPNGLDVNNVSKYSTRFHYHIDAENQTSLRRFLQLHYAEEGSRRDTLVKVYPIEHLVLGRQSRQEPIYKEMMNFHSIAANEYESPSIDEAFVTGQFKIDGSIHDPLKRLVETARSSGMRCMIECEEYVGDWFYKDGKFRGNWEVTESAAPKDLVQDILPKDNLVSIYYNGGTLMELHMGFDVPKEEFQQHPCNLVRLSDACIREGLSLGGWFVFRSPTHWKYRTNRFFASTGKAENFSDARVQLFSDTEKLATILKKDFKLVPPQIDCNLEIVHGIWQM
jgi:adenylate kinase